MSLITNIFVNINFYKRKRFRRMYKNNIYANKNICKKKVFISYIYYLPISKK